MRVMIAVICLSVTMLIPIYLDCMFEVRQLGVPCRVLHIYTVWTSLKAFRSRDMECSILLATLKMNTRMVLDMAKDSIYIVYNHYLEWRAIFFDYLSFVA